MTDLYLFRTHYRNDGIFGQIKDPDGNVLYASLEHSYPKDSDPDSFYPKIPAGEYTCIRGQHQLAHMSYPFTTFEITGVIGHSNLLFHKGNFNKDSEGCVLLGMDLETSTDYWWIDDSTEAFSDFMSLQSNGDEFTLFVVDKPSGIIKLNA